MIVVDSSALVAIVLGENGAERLLAALQGDVALVSAATLLESSIVVEARQGPDATRDLELLVEAGVDEVAAFDEEQAEMAMTAWRRFGKGRHAAGLNYGDCFSYALARKFNAALLFKGDDFGQTDIASVLAD